MQKPNHPLKNSVDTQERTHGENQIEQFVHKLEVEYYNEDVSLQIQLDILRNLTSNAVLILRRVKGDEINLRSLLELVCQIKKEEHWVTKYKTTRDEMNEREHPLYTKMNEIVSSENIHVPSERDAFDYILGIINSDDLESESHSDYLLLLEHRIRQELAREITMIRRQEKKRSFLRQVINLEFEEYMILIIYSIAYVFLSVVNKTTILFGETTRGQDLFFSFYIIMLLIATIKFAFEYKLPQFVRFTLAAIYSISFAYVVNLATSSF